jgi:uncharacterized protein involved in type VI secretion and phage assembly
MEEVLRRIARQVDDKRYGKYRGFVASNEDPEKRGRLKLRVPSVLANEESDWALPCFPFGGKAGHGWFFVPQVDAQVWVEFEEGDITRPIWVGCFYQREQDVPEPARKSEPTTYLLQTPNGHVLRLDDAEDQEVASLEHPSGAVARIDQNGVISLTDAGGSKVTLDAEGSEVRVEDSNGNAVVLSAAGVSVEDANNNRIELASAGITVRGQRVVVDASQVTLGGSGGEPVLKGSSFLTVFATHVHTATPGGGPTSPPTIPPDPSTLSTKVMTG